MIVISVIFVIKLHRANVPPHNSLDKKSSSKDNPYIQSVPQTLKEAKGYLPELKETLLQMDDKYIDSLSNHSEKEKRWLKEYRNVMRQNLQHVDEKESSVKVFTSTDLQDPNGFFVTQKGWSLTPTVQGHILKAKEYQKNYQLRVNGVYLALTEILYKQLLAGKDKDISYQALEEYYENKFNVQITPDVELFDRDKEELVVSFTIQFDGVIYVRKYRYLKGSFYVWTGVRWELIT